jgi:hypothetical protein
LLAYIPVSLLTPTFLLTFSYPVLICTSGFGIASQVLYVEGLRRLLVSSFLVEVFPWNLRPMETFRGEEIPLRSKGVDLLQQII